MKLFIIVIVSLAVIVLAFLWCAYTRLPDYKATISKVEIYSNNLDERIFIKEKVWGVSANHRVIVVSKSPENDFQPNENCEYVFKGSLPFFYKFENDTLNLYVRRKSTVPEKLSTNIQINQIVLSNPEMMALMDNYGEKGLKTIQ